MASSSIRWHNIIFGEILTQGQMNSYSFIITLSAVIHKFRVSNALTYTTTWSVSKVSVLIFYLNVYWTHLKLQVISLGSYTLVLTFFPLIIAVPEVIFRKCV